MLVQTVLKKEDFSPAMQRQIENELKKYRIEQQILHKLQFKWESKAIQIIKEKLAERKKKNLYKGNDWKVRFYEQKLALKPKLIAKLRSLIK